VVIPPNDLDLLEQTLANDKEIGVVILEPTGGHWGQVPVRGEFLRELRQLTAKHGQLLIFDEVITGFRVNPGGAQAHYGIKPDLTTLAKILAGGLPGGAVAGRADILAAIEVRPGRPKMRHPGTYNANPLSAAAGVAALARIADGEACRKANATALRLKRRLNALFAERYPDWIAYGDFSLLHILPSYDGPPPAGDDFVPYEGALSKLDGPRNPKQLAAWRHGLLLNGVDWFGFGAFVTAAHTDEDVERTIYAVDKTIDAMKADGLA
jgi:glutamate-1-semialdehyde 2,1-aminomutase